MFSQWGAKAAQLLGWSAGGVWFWTGGYQEYALNHSILEDNFSVMNIGIVLGALTAAVVGGLLMGYFARIAFGCKIGAFLSGFASTGLHGWL